MPPSSHEQQAGREGAQGLFGASISSVWAGGKGPPLVTPLPELQRQDPPLVEAVSNRRAFTNHTLFEHSPRAACTLALAIIDSAQIQNTILDVPMLVPSLPHVSAASAIRTLGYHTYVSRPV